MENLSAIKEGQITEYFQKISTVDNKEKAEQETEIQRTESAENKSLLNQLIKANMKKVKLKIIITTTGGLSMAEFLIAMQDLEPIIAEWERTQVLPAGITVTNKNEDGKSTMTIEMAKVTILGNTLIGGYVFGGNGSVKIEIYSNGKLITDPAIETGTDQDGIAKGSIDLLIS